MKQPLIEQVSAALAPDTVALPGAVAPGEPARRGRPRDLHCDKAIEAAALDLLVEQGFDGMSIEGVAMRAGVAKSTVYRRWDCKAALVVDAFFRRGDDSVLSADTGRVHDDLVEMLRALLHLVKTEGELMQALSAEQHRHPELGAAFRTTFLDQTGSAIREALRRGVERGEVRPDADLDLLVDVGAALMWYRLCVTGAPLDDDLPERIVEQFVPAPPRRAGAPGG